MGEQPKPGDITLLLSEWTAGRAERASELWPAVYRELRLIAGAYMRKERPDHTLQTTALVNEAYLKVFDGKAFTWENRKHFFCAMAKTMRRILVDHAREQCAEKRGGGFEKLAIHGALQVAADPDEVLALDEALERLSVLSARQAQVVELRFLVGLTAEETAAMLDVSPETVKLDWRFARAWLQRHMRTNH